uniref:Uncharacterized protein n=1 Tax=Oryza glaberrima TaxID=4538 RepID=I1PCI3_ORYGL
GSTPAISDPHSGYRRRSIARKKRKRKKKTSLPSHNSRTALAYRRLPEPLTASSHAPAGQPGAAASSERVPAGAAPPTPPPPRARPTLALPRRVRHRPAPSPPPLPPPRARPLESWGCRRPVPPPRVRPPGSRDGLRPYAAHTPEDGG